MKRPNLALVAGIFLAAISLWFSATGLVHLFSGAGIGIILMALGFEMAKISGVTWIIQKGRRSLLSVGLIFSVLLLSGVSSLGIYSYLGRAFNKGRTPSLSVASKSADLTARIASLQSSQDRLYRLIEAVPANQGTNRRRIQAQTQPKIDQIDAKISVLRDSLSSAASSQSILSNDIGDLRFAAELFGTTQEGLAKLIITVLAFLLDPLAVMLVMASGVKGKRAEFVPRKTKYTLGTPEVIVDQGDEIVEAVADMIESGALTVTGRTPTQPALQNISPRDETAPAVVTSEDIQNAQEASKAMSLERPVSPALERTLRRGKRNGAKIVANGRGMPDPTILGT